MGSKGFESPLISHARMRAMYRGLVEVRGLAERRKDKSFRGVEACWVAAAIDLEDDDLTCDTGGMLEAVVLEHLRGVGGRATGGAVQAGEIKRVLKQLAGATVDGFPGTAAERVMCAVGSAMALRAGETQNVVLAFVRTSGLNRSEWLRTLTVMGQEGLPLVVMALPGSEVDLEVTSAKTGKLAVPVIPVDAGDAVAIYRVAQETMVRARAGGGSSVILGVECGTDAVTAMGRQLVSKGICTERWVSGVQTHLAGLIARG